MNAPQEDLLELEIGAFMGPHIKRARIALVLLGILYAVIAYRDYDKVAKARDMMNAIGDGSAAFRALQSQVNVLYIFVVSTGIAGLASIVLAAIAGNKTTFAIYLATAIFAAHSAFYLYVTDGLMLQNILWWLTAICVGMGFQAAWKAEQLRKQRAQLPTAVAQAA